MIVNFNGNSFPAWSFRPGDSISTDLCRAIRDSKKNIFVALYELGDPGIVACLKQAVERGVVICVVLDHSHVFPHGKDQGGAPAARTPEMAELLAMKGVDIRVAKGLSSSGIMHNKFAVFDGAMAVFGSYNWTRTAEEFHWENIVFSADEYRVAFYQRLFWFIYDYGLPVGEAATAEWHLRKPGLPPFDTGHPLIALSAAFPNAAASPCGDVDLYLETAINCSRTSIRIAMFSFYSVRLAQALLRAKERGVKVSLVLDHGQARMLQLEGWFLFHGFDLRLLRGPDGKGSFHSKMHNKFMIIDGRFLETGSYNYSPNAELHNFENANFFDEPNMVQSYVEYFEKMWSSPLAEEPKAPEECPNFDPQDRTSHLRKLSEQLAGVV